LIWCRGHYNCVAARAKGSFQTIVASAQYEENE
jgi:hypothetical protein